MMDSRRRGYSFPPKEPNLDELYRMILVDDEDEVRGRISSKISSESGFAVVGTAGNGYDALELIEKFSPHVVLTDIRMPFIDGIELARTIRRDFPATRVAFISGYDEFDYARKAVELHVSSYLTKPVTQNDISLFLRQLKEELDEEFKRQYNLELLRKRYEESLPLLIDNYFASVLIASPTAGNPGDIENLRQYGISLDDSRYLLAFVRVERDEELKDVMEYENRRLAVRSVALNVLDRHGCRFYSFPFSDGIVFVIKEEGALFLKRIDQIFTEMIQLSRRFLSAGIDIGVSHLHRNFDGLKNAYLEAERALDNSRFLNTGRIVYIGQLDKSSPRPLSVSEGDSSALEYAVKFGSDGELREVLNRIRAGALENRPEGASYKLYVINLVNIAVNYASSINADIQETAGEDVLDAMGKFRNLDQVFDWILSLFLKLRKVSVSTRMNNSQRLLDSAVSYIHTHFSNPGVTMESVCEDLGISVSYLSLLFKRHRDTTFVRYLTQVRMEKAMELLRLTEDRIVEIAGQCGFKDVYYFSHSFKKYRGVSPKKYREENHS